MQPFERFEESNTEGNLWIYILSLGKEREVINDDVRMLIFEKFGFLPGNFLVRRVLYRLKTQGYVKSEKYKGKLAFRTTERGKTELEKMRNFCQELLEKV